MGVVKPQLAADLKKLDKAGIPIDIRFDQGLRTLGLEQVDTTTKAPSPAPVSTSPD